MTTLPLDEPTRADTAADAIVVRVGQADVVDSDLERRPRVVDERGERVARPRRRLAAVYERERLYSRFHA